MRAFEEAQRTGSFTAAAEAKRMRQGFGVGVGWLGPVCWTAGRCPSTWASQVRRKTFRGSLFIDQAMSPPVPAVGPGLI